MAIIQKPFYFIRHGETPWNIENRFTGQADIPLTEEGRKQAEEAGKLLQNKNIKFICHSSLLRARHTAEIINSHVKASLIEIADLQECSWGPYEGKNKSEWEGYQEWWNGRNFEGVESYENFSKRVLKSMNHALNFEGPVAVVAHGAFYRTLANISNLPSIPKIPNALPVYYSPLENDLEWDFQIIKKN